MKSEAIVLSLVLAAASVRANAAAAAPQESSWEAAKSALPPLWRAGLGTLGLKEHLAYWDKSGTTVVFAAGNKSTYDAERKAAVWSEDVLKEVWDHSLAQGKTPQEALQLLTLKSLPGFAHLLRDGMMDEPLLAQGIKFRAALIENETVHNWEEAGVTEALEKLHPGLYKEAIFSRLLGWNDVDSLDIKATKLKEARSKGPAGMMNHVRYSYSAPSILLYDRKYLIAAYDEQLQKAPGTGWVRDALETLRDDAKYERLKEYSRAEVAKVGLTPESMQETYDRESYDLLMRMYSDDVKRQRGGIGGFPSLETLERYRPQFEPFLKKYGWKDPTSLLGSIEKGVNP